MGEFLRCIPVELNGLRGDDYEDLGNWGDGYKLAFALVANPYEEVGRVALLEWVAGIVGESLVERIPDKGYQPEELHVLDGTKYDGLAKFADWVWSDTGSVFLDCNDEMDNPTSWHPDEVRDLTDAWAVAEVYNKGMCDITTWLEEKPSTHMRELLDFIEGKPSIPREQLRFPGKDFNEPED